MAAQCLRKVGFLLLREVRSTLKYPNIIYAGRTRETQDAIIRRVTPGSLVKHDLYDFVK